MRIFASTPLYVQGPGTIAKVGEIATRIGSPPAIVIDALVRPLVGVALEAGFDGTVAIAEFAGEVTDANIAAVAMEIGHAGVIVAVGGGKALDAGKAVALKLGIPMISVPTIASTDGPASRGIAIYDDAHRLTRVDQMPANPAAVVVDTAVIAGAPPRFLRAGIGDAIAKKFEGEGCWAGGGLTKHGTRPTHSARAIANAAYLMLREHAVAGMAAAERNEVTEDLEATIEASVLLSAMAFENGGLSIAHSTTRGLMTLRNAKDRLHGEHVAYGTLVQLAVDGQQGEALMDLAEFLRDVGLPTTLAELGVVDVSEIDLDEIAAAIMNSPHIGNVERPLTHRDVVIALRQVESLGSR
ncbi:glycerol dehydrogenase [Novosphingobium cyanobacteriorum]|uniref:Glycerol dehydrogenase n=1 Tax=Novosphingobium cyanobacteriorum TaxID=3024215 RepID=A0ABT6CQD4_9SPHN|nr:glycerol dehydrogenase [Novosphingobium cyanobacteriorum]MDF8334592.1 glycerol dehydrogenase [Novosphingobium cyanobacteriorum]